MLFSFMKKHTRPKHSLFALFLVLLILVIPGCTSSSDGGGDSSTGAVAGIITAGTTNLPLADVNVSISTITANTNTDGQYELTGVPTGNQTLTAKKAGFDTYTQTLVIEADQTTTLDFSMNTDSTKGTVVGTVTDTNTGNPVEYATVTISTYSSVTDEKGHFIIGNLTTGNYPITVVRQGYSNYSSTVDVVERQLITMSVKLTPLEQMGSVKGVITDAQSGASLEDVLVTINELSTLSDAEGQYLITGIPSGEQSLTASRTGYSSYSTTITIETGKTTTSDFSLTPQSEIGAAAGTVTDNSTGYALSEVEVAIAGLTTLSGEQGFYYLRGIPAGDQTITATKNGYTDYTGTITITAGGLTEQNISLTPASTGGTVMGMVTCQTTGLPLDGVTVTIGSVSDKTNTDGTYILNGAPLGKQTITGEKTGYQGYTGEVEVLQDTITFHSFTLTPVSTTGIVAGTVTDSNTGAELQDVEVAIGVQESKTDSEGYYQIEGVEAGTQTITARKLGYQDYSGSVTVEAGNIVYHDFEMTPKSLSGSVTGIVYDQDTGEPITGAWVSVGYNITRSDSDGIYRIDGVTAGNRNMFAIKHAYYIYGGKVDVKAGETVIQDIPMIRFEIRGAVQGQVTDAQTGAMLENTIVTVGFSGTLSDNSGRYYIGSLIQGLKIVTALKPGYYPYLGAVYIDAGSTKTHNIAMTPYVTVGTVKGTVTDAGNGEPLEDVNVEVDGSSTETDKNGNYDIDGIEAGLHRITATKMGYYEYRGNVSVTAGETTIKDIEMSPKPDKGMVGGMVTNATTGLPIHNVLVSIDSAETKTDILGFYLLTGIKAGNRTITAHKHGFQTYSSTVQVSGGKLVISNIQMSRIPKTGDLSGVITDSATSQKLENAFVSCNGNSTYSDENGNYVLQGIYEGDRTVVVDKPGYQEYSSTVTITGGQKTIKDIALTAFQTKGSVEGTVTDSVFNAPLQGVMVDIKGHGGGFDFTSESGYYKITGLDEGKWKIQAKVSSYQVYNDFVNVTAGQTTTFNIQMTPIPGSGSLSGTVTDSVYGTPVAGVTVSIGDRTAKTDSNGNYRFRHADPGAYNITAQKHGYKGYAGNVNVTAGSETIFNIQLIPGN